MSAGHGVNLFQNIADAVGLSAYETLIAAGSVAVLVLVGASIAVGAHGRAADRLVPDATLSIRNVFDLLATLVVKLGDLAMGKENRKYIPFVSTVFVFLLFSNLIGLIPGFSAPTDLVYYNFGIAIVVFLSFNFWGIREHGLLKYFKHFCGPVHLSWIVVAIAPLLLVVELVSMCFRPVTLTLRLAGNMTADHSVLDTFFGLTQGTFLPVPVLFYMLGTLVCFIQAFVFTVLTMVYIRLATAHEGEDHEESDAHGEAAH